MSDSDTTTEGFAGGCFCGEIRYRAAGHTGDSSLCHCRHCQHQSGAPVVAWLEVKRSDIVWSGPDRSAYARRSDWPTPVRRTFCGNCGTTLTYEREGSDYIDIATVTLDDPDAVPPGRHVYVSRQRAWLHIDDGLPRHATLRDRSDE